MAFYRFTEASSVVQWIVSPQVSQVALVVKKNPPANAGHLNSSRRCGFHPWVRKIPWRRAWQPTPVFSPGESHGQKRELQFKGLERVENDWSDLAAAPPYLIFNYIINRLYYTILCIVIVQSLRCVQLFATPWTAAHQISLSFTISQSLLKFMSVESVIPSNHLILCHPLLLLPLIFSSIRVFSNEPALSIRWPKYWSFSFSISASNEYSGLISFRIDWFDLVVQGTLTSLLQHHRINSSVCSLLYGSALTRICDYWKNHSFDYTDLCWQSDVTAFLPRSKCLLISWLQSPSIVNLEPRK